MSGGNKTLLGLAAARASIAGLLDRPATAEELDGCVGTLDEAIRAVELLPTSTGTEQRKAARLIALGLTEVRNTIKRRAK